MKALVVGATGLVGGELLSLLLDSNNYSEVNAITRKTLPEHPKLKQFLSIADELSKIPEAFEVDDVYCCLGTTIKKAGSKEAFRKIDFDYPFEVAKRSLGKGANQFLLVTALGANTKSLAFYNRVKGEIEEAIGKLGFASVQIFRPSMLMGSRPEKRILEDIAKVAFSIFGPLFVGPIKRFKAVEGSVVAKSMFKVATLAENGINVYSATKIQEYK